MSESKEFTLQEVSGHNTKKDLYMVIHDKVYDCTSFVDEHPYVESSSYLPLPRTLLLSCLQSTDSDRDPPFAKNDFSPSPPHFSDSVESHNA